MIHLTPLEVRKKKGDFRRALRGYDPLLVDDFLDIAADRLEQLVRENLALQDRVAQQTAQLTENRDRERALTEALLSAQEMRDEARRESSREAELARLAAEQRTEQLRAAVEAEMQQLRDPAHAAAAEELESIRREREREEELLREVRERQQELVSRYRAFLEEELTALVAMVATADALDAPVLPHIEADAEPFEPEAFIDETTDVVEPVAAQAVAPVAAPADEAVPADQAAVAEVDPFGWDAGIAEDEIDLIEDAEYEIDTSILLRNAAAAGYRLEDDHGLADELLLEDTVVEDDTVVDEDVPDDGIEDDGWLPSLLEDDK